MFLLIPVQTEVVFQRWPIMNFVLIGTCVLSYISFNILNSGGSIFYAMILDGWSAVGLVGHLFLHADFMHLLENMIFLWVFGNAYIAYWAHIGGIVFGISAGYILLKRGSVKLSSFDNPDLLTILKLHYPIEEIGFNCPDCGKPQRIYESQIGGQIHCWSCRTPIHLEEDI
jgi:hypothetical protein